MVNVNNIEAKAQKKWLSHQNKTGTFHLSYGIKVFKNIYCRLKIIIRGEVENLTDISI